MFARHRHTSNMALARTKENSYSLSAWVQLGRPWQSFLVLSCSDFSPEVWPQLSFCPSFTILGLASSTGSKPLSGGRGWDWLSCRTGRTPLLQGVGKQRMCTLLQEDHCVLETQWQSGFQEIQTMSWCFLQGKTEMVTRLTSAFLKKKKKKTSPTTEEEVDYIKQLLCRKK